MSRLPRWLLTLIGALVTRLLRRRPRDEDGASEPSSGPPAAAAAEAGEGIIAPGEPSPAAAPEERPGRIVAAGEPDPRAELVVLALLGLAALCALGFVVVYAMFGVTTLPNELLGLCLGLCFVLIAAALAVVAKRLVVSEQLEDDYPTAHPAEQSEVAEMVHEAGSRFTRKRLLLTAGGLTGGALGLAAITPALSLGPVWDTGPLDRTPWRRGVRLVDEDGRPIAAADIVERSFYTGFPEGGDPEELASPLVLVRVDPAKLELPPERSGWAPEGILAFSKICTHAGCAVALYRKPTFPVVEPHSALVCPCHYSTFNPLTGGTVIYGPAGRPLPQLPLEIDVDGNLRAAGNYSGRVGPAWLNVLRRPT
jgi:ubiquinol-cytochrome c reductase iron-sulfur subunit